MSLENWLAEVTGKADSLEPRTKFQGCYKLIDKLLWFGHSIRTNIKPGVVD